MRRSKRKCTRKSSAGNTNSSARSINIKECKEDHISEPERKRLKIVLRKSPTGETHMKDVKENKNFETDEKTRQSVGRGGSTGNLDVKQYNKNQRSELDGGKLQNTVEERSVGNTDIKECKGNQGSEQNKEKRKVNTVIVRKGSSACTNRKEYTQDQKRDKETLTIVDRKSSIESTDQTKCTEGQNTELDKTALRIVVRKNSETGEWTAFEDQCSKISNKSAFDRSGSGFKMKAFCSPKETNISNLEQEEQQGVYKNTQCETDLVNHNLKVTFDGETKKSYVEKETKLCCNEQINGARNSKLPEQIVEVERNHDKIEQNILSVTNDPKASTKVAEYSSKGVITVEFFEDGDSIICNDIDNSSNSHNEDNSKTNDLEKMVDIKLFPYKHRSTIREAIEKKGHVLYDSSKGAVTEDSPTSKREEVKFTSADVVVVDYKDGRILEESCSDNEFDAEIKVNESENVIPLEQNVGEHTEPMGKSKQTGYNQYCQHSTKKNPHWYESLTKRGVNLNETCKVADETIIRVDDSECGTPNDETWTQMNSQDIVKCSHMAYDLDGKDNERLLDMLTKDEMLGKRRSNPQVEVQRTTICESNVLGLNDKSNLERSAVLNMTDSVMRRSVLSTSAKRMDRVQDYTGRNSNNKQNDNGAVVNSTRNGEQIATLEPGSFYTDINDRAVEAVSGVAFTNVNEFCLNQPVSVQSVDNVKENCKGIQYLISWKVDQGLYHDNLSYDVTSNPVENQYEDVIAEFNENLLESSDENNNCLIEIYVIDDNEMDINNKCMEQRIISDASAYTEVKRQLGSVDFGTKSGLFEPNTDCYQSENEVGFRSLRYDGQVFAETNDLVSDGHVCFGASNSVMPEYDKQNSDLQMNEDWLGVDSSLNLPPVTDIKYDNVPYWDTCLVQELETKSYRSEKNKPRKQKNARGGRGRKNKRSTKIVNSIKVEDMNVLKTEVKAGNDRIKQAAKNKKGLKKQKYSNVKDAKGRGKRKNHDLCTRIEDDFIGREQLLRKLKNGKFGVRPHVVRVSDQGIITDVTEEYHQHLPYLHVY